MARSSLARSDSGLQRDIRFSTTSRIALRARAMTVSRTTPANTPAVSNVDVALLISYPMPSVDEMNSPTTAPVRL